MKPLAIDLYCGLGGWTEALLAEGYDVIGFDIERHQYGEHRYPAQLVLQDVRTLHGSQFKNAGLIVCSPPCQKYSYMAMPWKRSKAMAAAIRADTTGKALADLNCLFDACFRIQREACEAAGRHIPLIVENVRGAQKWVGRARWNFGSFYLWGDVPALMPMTIKAVKVGGLNWSRYGEPGYKGEGFTTRADRNLREDIKNTGGSWFNVAHNTTSGKGRNPDGRKGVGPKWDPVTKSGAHGMKRWTNPSEGYARADRAEDAEVKLPSRTVGATPATGANSNGRKLRDHDGYDRDHPAAFGWKSPRTSSGAITARKMASAMIAKIPAPLARHIAVTFRACCK